MNSISAIFYLFITHFTYSHSSISLALHSTPAPPLASLHSPHSAWNSHSAAAPLCIHFALNSNHIPAIILAIPASPHWVFDSPSISPAAHYHVPTFATHSKLSLRATESQIANTFLSLLITETTTNSEIKNMTKLEHLRFVLFLFVSLSWLPTTEAVEYHYSFYHYLFKAH